ncbi:MAG: 2-C-methyl-D-erythritol 2,4-cyclodiphosphate synthase [Planctomycetota bacterium]
MTYRIGLGEDAHRLETGGPLRLGGIDMPHDKQAVGHSDADVLLHAITDALLGAVSDHDIGGLFPNTDPANAGRDSVDFLKAAYQLVGDAGYELANLDCVVVAQRPKLLPFKDAIRQRIAEVLDVPAAAIGLKAKTGEGVGPVGREEAIEARCVALVIRAE